MCWVSVAQENWPVELVPKIGVGIMGIHVNKMRRMYHTGKNGVKAGETLGSLWKNSACLVCLVYSVCLVYLIERN